MVRKRVMGRNVVVVTDLDVIRDITRDREHFLHRAPTGIREIIPLGLLGMASCARTWSSPSPSPSPSALPHPCPLP